MRSRLYSVLGPTLLLTVTLLGVSAGNAQPSPIADQTSQLGPGQFIWQPQRASTGPLEIVVSLGGQLAYVFRSGETIGIAAISSGTADRPTPTGRFKILQKLRFHRSNKYDDAPMPYMLRLTWSGVAMHAGQNPGYPASHGCIRLPSKFAAQLFAVAPVGSTVLVTDDAPGSPAEALALLQDYVPPVPSADNAPLAPAPT